VTVRDWLANREPSPPRVLRERIDALASSVARSDGDPAVALVAAAELALVRLSACAPDDRATALDLLAADALVTYAFELASQTPDSIPELSAGAMARLSAVTP
jgi:hypothetical protein